MTLAELQPKQPAIVEKVEVGAPGEGFLHRLEAMGIVPNRSIQVLRKAWFGGPLHIRVGSTTELAIRRQEAKLVIVKLAIANQE